MTTLADKDVEIWGLVVHCSDSPQGRGDDAREIHRWHLRRGWHGCGYHYVILEDGTVQKGRPDWWRGSHVGKYNTGTIGILLIGDDEFTEHQRQALYQLVKRLEQEYPKAKVYGHRDLDPGKTCPNFDAADLIERYRAADQEP